MATTDIALAPLLAAAIHTPGTSDVHVRAGTVPKMRVNTILHTMNSHSWDDAAVEVAIRQVVPVALHQRFDNHQLEVDFSLTWGGVRFRGCAFHTLGRPAVVLRMVPTGAKTVTELHLPDRVGAFATVQRGLLLVTGPTGSGKSTTLATLIDTINRDRAVHIVTLEDPVELLHTDQQSSITQREIGVDTATFADGVRSAMRQDPDVILIGELRDAETAKAALTAAETGHFVVSTMHTSDAQETINRFIDLFPPEKHHHVRLALADNLSGVIAQRLMVSTAGDTLVPCCEILVNTQLVSDTISDATKNDTLNDIMVKDRSHGMCTFEQSLVELVRTQQVAVGSAMETATNSNDLRIMLRNEGLITAH